MAAPEGTDDFALVEVSATETEEAYEESWFAERRSTSSFPPPRRSSVPPMGDSDVDRWLR